MLHAVSSLKDLNTSSAAWYYTVVKDADPGNPFGTYVDVRDLAELHALSLLNEKVGGERFLINAGGFNWQDWGMFFTSTSLYDRLVYFFPSYS
jgi:hypothetical protein